MSDKTYPVIILAHLGRVERFTETQLRELKASCEKALAQAEADKPKNWDFGIARNGVLAIKEPLGFVSFGPGRLGEGDICILGNLKKIIEEEGPIVVGFTPEQARTIAKLMHGHGSPSIHNLVMSRICGALDRFNENKPEASNEE